MAAGDSKRPYIVDGTKSSSHFGSMSFSDEFTGNSLSGRWHNRQPHWQSSSHANSKRNFDVTNGTCRIWATGDTSDNSFNRCLSTDTHFHFRYGYFECRAKLPRGFGLWPGFWTLSTVHDDPYHEEIDFMEAYCGGGPHNGGQTWATSNNEPVDFEANVWGPNGIQRRDNRGKFRMQYRPGFSALNLTVNFNIFAGLWEPDGITFYFNGRQMSPKVFTRDINDFHSLNIQCWAGSASGSPVPESVKNSNHAVLFDYVRVWHLASGASQVQNHLSNWGNPPAVDPATDGGSVIIVNPNPTPAPKPGPAPAPAPAPSPSPSPTPTPDSPGFNTTHPDLPYGSVPGIGPMTFRDEFDSFKENVWHKKLWYERDSHEPNWVVKNSKLLIYPTSAFVNRAFATNGNFEQRYGYFEASLKLNSGKGVWPAWWLYGHPGSNRPEIDMMEAWPGGGQSTGWGDSNLHPNNFGMTLHKANSDYSYHEIPYATKLGDHHPKRRLDLDFHKYGALWTKDFIQFYFEGQPIGVKHPNDYWHWPMYMILDLWYGLASGNPDATTPLGEGNAFEVEWVRAWGLADGSHSVQTTLPAPTLYGPDTGTPTVPAVPALPSNQYKAGDKFAIRYENGEIKYLHNGVVKRTVPDVGADKSFYFDSSFYSVGSKLQGVVFGRLGTVDWSAITGAGKPEDNATNGAILGVNVRGQITADNAPVFIQPKAIKNELIDSILQSDTYLEGVSGWKLDKEGNVELNNAVFRGIIEANLIRAQHIQANNVTEFSQEFASCPNNTTVHVPFKVSHAGRVAIITQASYSWSGAASSANASFSIRVDGGQVRTTRQNGYAPSQLMIMHEVYLNAGTHYLSVVLYHSHANANHLLSASVFRSYR